MIPGEIFVDENAPPITANEGRATQIVLVEHTGDRPIQVGSHFHFFETNRALRFDRSLAYGMRLNIPAGTAVRFEPGESKEVTLTSFAGACIVYGANALVQGELDNATSREQALAQLHTKGFLSL